MGRGKAFGCAALVGVIGGGALVLTFVAEASGVSPLSRVLMSSVAAEEPAPPAERPKAAEAAPRRALLFQRFISEGGTARGGVLEAALFEGRQVQLRELYSFPQAESFFVPLGVAQGKVYARHLSDLVVLDLAGGTLELVSHIRGEGYVSGPYFYRFQHAERTSELKVYDFSRGLERSIPLPEKVPEPVQPALSPDGRKVAYSVPSDWPQERTDGALPRVSYERHLVVVDLETGRFERSAQTFPQVPSPWGSDSFTGLEGVPLRWLDGETLLLLDIAGVEPKGASVWMNPEAYWQVVGYDTKTGKTRVVTKLPGDPWRSKFEFVEPGRFDVVRLRQTVMPMWSSSDYLFDAAAGEVREDPGQGCVGYRLLESPAGTQLRYGEDTLDQANRFTLVPCLETKQVAWIPLARRRVMYYEPGLSEPVEVTQEWVSEHMLWFDPEQLEPSAQPQAAQGWEPIHSGPFPKPEGLPPGSRPVASAFILQVIPDKEVYALHDPVNVTIRLSNVSDTDFEIANAGFEDVAVEFGGRLELAGQAGTWSWVGQRVTLAQKTPMVIAAGETVEVQEILELPAAGDCLLSASLAGGREPLRKDGGWFDNGASVRSPEFSLKVEMTPDEAERAAAKVDRLAARMYRDVALNPHLVPRGSDDLRKMRKAAEPELMILAAQETDLARLGVLLRSLARAQSTRMLEVLLPLWQREEPEAKLLALEHLSTFWGREEVRAILVESLGAEDPAFRRRAAELVSRQWDLALRPAFEKLLTSDDEAVREIAAGYLLALPRVNLEERIGQLLAQEDTVSFALARYLVGQLERTFHQDKGAFPTGSWEEVSASETARKQYREVLEAWRKWVAEHPRTTASFFDWDRGMWRQRSR